MSAEALREIQTTNLGSARGSSTIAAGRVFFYFYLVGKFEKFDYLGQRIYLQLAIIISSELKTRKKMSDGDFFPFFILIFIKTSFEFWRGRNNVLIQINGCLGTLKLAELGLELLGGISYLARIT